MSKFLATSLAALSLTTLGACGGGGFKYASFGDPASRAISSLSVQQIDTATQTTAQGGGVLNRAANSAEIDTLGGTINAARTQIAVNGGGVIDLTGTTAFARFFDAQPTAGSQRIGIVGVITALGDMPSTATTSYIGTTNVTVQDNLDLYTLTGDATIDANFSGGTLNVTLGNLSGTRGPIVPVAVTNVGTLTITGATITGTTASGGTATLTSATLNGGTGLSGAATVQHEAGFYGPAATEVGGVLVVQDGPGFQILGQYLGD